MLPLLSAEYRAFEGEATAHRTCRDFLVTDCCADTTFPVSVGADPSYFVKRHVYFVISPPNSEHPAASRHVTCRSTQCVSLNGTLSTVIPQALTFCGHPHRSITSLSLTCIVDLRVTFQFPRVRHVQILLQTRSCSLIWMVDIHLNLPVDRLWNRLHPSRLTTPL